MYAPWKNTFGLVSLATVGVITLTSLFLSPIFSIIVLLSYISGQATCWFVKTSHIDVRHYVRKVSILYYSTKRQKDKNLCTVCKDSHCRRHKNPKVQFPWRGLMIQENLNNSIEDIYNQILETYISSWYAGITDDTMLLNELRHGLRFVSAVFVNKLLEINSTKLFTHKLIPCLLQHINDFSEIQGKALKTRRRIEDVALEHLGRRLHFAAMNRENEISYLQNLTTCLLPHILPEAHFKCRNYAVLIRELLSGWVLLSLMDIICNPNTINSLVIYAISAKSFEIQQGGNRFVEFLENFGSNKDAKSSVLSFDLTAAMKNTEILYAFMQFLKHEGQIHLLHFCLDFEEFSRKLLNMEAKDDVNIHYKEAKHLYKLYLDPKSPNSVGCPEEIVNGVQQLLQGNRSDITNFSKSIPLYKAYDYAYGVLDDNWLPSFCHSDDFYTFLCGPRIQSGYSKSSEQFREKRYADSGNHGAVSKIGSGFSRIRGVLRTELVEGEIFPIETKTFEGDQPQFVEGPLADSYLSRDLSAWRISVSSSENQFGATKFNSYIINVKRIDTCSDDVDRLWSVQRLDKDFYVLRDKLIEFHGEGEIYNSPLPSRRAAISTESRCLKYEEFLKSLLQKPSLRKSDLVYTFLTTEEDFHIIATSLPSIGDIGIMYQSVAYKLKKERGQYLDPFMNSFLASTEAEKEKLDQADICEEVGIVMKNESDFQGHPLLKNPVFGNNFGVVSAGGDYCGSVLFGPCDITKCILYILRHIFKVPPNLLHLYSAVCNLSQQTVEFLCHKYITYRLKAALSQDVLAYLLQLLKGLLFHKKHARHTALEIKMKHDEAMDKIESLAPKWLVNALGENVNDGMKLLLEAVQNPQLNKQLSYSLLDIIVGEMYPALSIPAEPKK